MAMSQSQYLAKKGVHCPFCGSDEISGESINVDAGAAEQEVSCLVCGAQWTDTYLLAGYRFNHRPTEEEAANAEVDEVEQTHEDRVGATNEQVLLNALIDLQKQIHAHYKMNVKRDVDLMLADSQASKAIHQAQAPKPVSNAVQSNEARTTIIGPWDSERYGHEENPRGPDFEVSILDHLERDGQVFIDVRPDGGNIDDLLSTMVEVAAHPETGQPVPVVRVHRGDECVASVYADGMDKALLVLAKTDLRDGLLRVKED